MTIVRPVPWARAIGDLRFAFERWGDRVIRIGSPGGTHLLIRRRGAAELQLWLPSGLAPASGGSFGIYLHPDASHASRVQAAATFRRSIGHGVPIRAAAYAQAHRHAAMLYVHDLVQGGASLRDVAGRLLDRSPEDWRSSSIRSDLRRLVDAAAQMVAGGYRLLLGSRPPS
ncbi:MULTISPECIES: DNA -binding domain-containing protein [unclassified Sphingobium]|uniref:DNA -binding domain-containing protein n=1 Tax=unclassified Sphingobium TaxID=2611147 RepID=UPI0035A58605